ncbi:hypothetical protein ACH4VR_36270 [Streptomyces sp. NPDC020883]|uniref:hypothetical protein n=1 Tax=Streptomyces sp. NPDC020883 TaxID=3365099 RepID=UPI00379602C5
MRQVPWAIDSELRLYVFYDGNVMTELWSESRRARLQALAAAVEERKATAPVPAETMAAALTAGEAHALGDFPGAPIRYRENWWVLAASAWRAVDEPTQALFDADAERYKLALAVADGNGAGNMPATPPASIEELRDFVSGLAMNDLPQKITVNSHTALAWERIDAPPGCTAWAVVWPTGAQTSWHAHGEAVAAFLVVSGCLEEELVAPLSPEAGQQADASTAARLRIERGAPHEVPVHRVHRLSAAMDGPAISVHVACSPHPTPCHEQARGVSQVQSSGGEER